MTPRPAARRLASVSIIGILTAFGVVFIHTSAISQDPGANTVVQGVTYEWNGKEYAPVAGVMITAQRDGGGLHPQRGYWTSKEGGKYEVSVKSGSPITILFHYGPDKVPEVQRLSAKPGDRHTISPGTRTTRDYMGIESKNPSVVPLRDIQRSAVAAVPRDLPLDARKRFEDDLEVIGRAAGYNVSLLVPAYFEPPDANNPSWVRLRQTAKAGLQPVGKKDSRRVSVVAIVNPDSGPGAKVQPNYREICRQAKEAGIRLLGYCHVGHGKVTPEAFATDVAKYIKFYPEVSGVFIDEYPNMVTAVDYGARLWEESHRAFTKAGRLPPVVIGNPGTDCPMEFIQRPTLAAACTFENKLEGDLIPLPGWVQRGDGGRAAVIAYGVSPRSVKGVWDQLTRAEIRYVYLTDERDVRGVLNPWTRLPSYWADLVAMAHERNAPRFSWLPRE